VAGGRACSRELCARARTLACALVAVAALFSAEPDFDVGLDSGANTFTCAPMRDADGCDAAARATRVRPSGTLAGASLSATPSFELRFQARVQ